jgi:hypothetical protein
VECGSRLLAYTYVNCKWTGRLNLVAQLDCWELAGLRPDDADSPPLGRLVGLPDKCRKASFSNHPLVQNTPLAAIIGPDGHSDGFEIQSARRGRAARLNWNKRAHESIFTQRPAGILGYKKATHNHRVETTVFHDGLGLGMGSLSSEQLEISRSAGIPEQPQRFGCGAFLLFRIG